MNKPDTGQKAVVLVNLGSPSAPEAGAVARFLKLFLGDPRVVEIPRLLWLPLLYCVIAPLRSRRSAKKYHEIWWPEGSPLTVMTERQSRGLQQLLDTQLGGYQVRHAFTYGKPGIAATLQALQDEGVESICLLPLYPQYSATTTASVVDQMAGYLQQQRNPPALRYIRSYASEPIFIDALAQSVRAHWQQHGRGERLLMSFHGIPKRCVEQGDPYQRECEATASLLAEALALEADQWTISYQSRLGPAEWLGPSTVQVLQQWGAEQLGSIDVICPAFAADCLETLEEIQLECRDVYGAAGGGEFRYIPCLNDSAAHLQMMAQLVTQ